ncbi:hypothetical protein [Dokdonella immobilis]|uniref:Uncharacterized protein n=1 Tax=Dokdonella immobilis TaxID=578942 RepID=A0A1I4X7K2_9GAMM|nr:hypothetical protein [Dokdonella immobilis]SFN21350.1 hypothetical protein SAMN05216289_1088 [Dokdonella immobilis]
MLEVVDNTRRPPYLETARALARWRALDRMSNLQSELLAGEHDYTPLAEKREYAEGFGAQCAAVGGLHHGTTFDAVAACNAVALAFFRGEPLPDADTLKTDASENTSAASPAESLD